MHITVFFVIDRLRYGLDAVPLPPSTIVVIDRGYIDVATLCARPPQQLGSSSVPRDDLRYTWIASREVDKSTGLRSDQTIARLTQNSLNAYPGSAARRVLPRPPNASLPGVPTNRFRSARVRDCRYYRNRWQIELFPIRKYPDSN